MRTQCGHCTEVHTTLAAVRECARTHGFRTTIPGQRPAAFEPAETAAHAQRQRAALTEADLFPDPGQETAAPQEPAGAAPRPQAEADVPGDEWKKLTPGRYNVPEAGIVIVRISGATGFPYASTRNGAGELEYRKGLIRTMHASQKIDEPDLPARGKDYEAEAGIYFHNGIVYKVKRAVHGSGHMYAKKLDLDLGTWLSAPGMAKKLGPEHKLTAEQALEVAATIKSHPQWGIYGVCFVCGRVLTDEESITLGIGPICYGKIGGAAA